MPPRQTSIVKNRCSESWLAKSLVVHVKKDCQKGMRGYVERMIDLQGVEEKCNPTLVSGHF